MNLIQLEQTKNHYLLTIPQALMTRAKKIKPRQWDSISSVWKYPRNKDTYQLLINEFENDVEMVTITPPKLMTNNQADKIVKQNKKISNLENQVRALKSKIELAESQRNHFVESEAEHLNRIVKLTAEIEYLKDDSTDLEKNIKKITKLCIGKDHPLSNTLEEIEFDSMLPIHLQNKLENLLRSKLKIKPQQKKNILEIINECRYKGLLSKDTLYFLHVIRKQRNLFAHETIDQKTRLMRVVFVIAAFSIMSSEL
jgi:hypothetical protein